MALCKAESDAMMPCVIHGSTRCQFRIQHSLDNLSFLTVSTSSFPHMADVIGILGFSLHAAHKVYYVVASIKDAPSDIQALQNDALQVHSFLDKIVGSQEGGERPRNATVSLGVQDVQIDALLKRARGIQAAVDAFIGKTTTRKEDGTVQVKRLKWPLYAGDAKKLSKQFKAFYASLTAVYTVTTSFVFLPFHAFRALKSK